ncbi:MAG: SDR family NAD(P)-dependent oxidoreductase [Candidatus Geothermincolia bacterium]
MGDQGQYRDSYRFFTRHRGGRRARAGAPRRRCLGLLPLPRRRGGSRGQQGARAGGQGGGGPGDLSREEDAECVAATAIRELGGIDILVNNSGVRELAPIHELSSEMLERTIGANLFSCFYMAKHAVRHMIETGRRGCVVNLSSIAGRLGISGGTAYAASKAGVEGFTVCLGRELARHGIRVNALAPGYIDTEMLDDMDEAGKAALLPRIPMRRLGTAGEIARAVAFLIEDATYVTGQTLVMDGGILID